MITGIHHVAIATTNLDRMVAFYRDLLGFELVYDDTWPMGTVVADRVTALEGSSAHHLMFRKGNAYFELFEYTSPTPAPGQDDRRVCDPGYTHLCLDVTELDAEYERLVAAGMVFHCAPQNVGFGVRTTYGRDPDGNVIELQELATADHSIALPSH